MNEQETKVEETKVEETKVETAETPVETTEEKAGLDIVGLVTKNLKWIVLAAVALILICIIASCASNKDRYTRTEDLSNCYEQIDSDLLVTMNGKELSTEEDISSVRYSDDNSLTVVKTVDGVLYVVKKDKLVEVDEDIDSYIISTFGDSIAYMKDVEDYVGELFLFNVAKEEAVKVDSEAYEEYYTLSPDGKTIAYVGNCEIETDEWWGYKEFAGGDVFVSKNGKDAEKLYKDAVPVAISDNAKYVYYVEDFMEDGKLYVNGEKIVSDIDSVDGVFFNNDLSEMLYEADGDTKYYKAAKNTDVKVKSSGLYSVVVPSDTIFCDMNDAYYVGIDTFNKTVLKLNAGYYYMYDKGEETEKVSSEASSMLVSEDGKSLLYVEDDDLVYIKNVTKSREEDVIGENLDIRRLRASKDLKKIYFVDEDEELFFFKKNDKSVSIADDVTDIVYSDEFGGVYFIEDEELFYATKNEKSKKSIAEDVTDVYKSGDKVLYTVDEDDEEVTYIMTGKDKSKLFSE